MLNKKKWTVMIYMAGDNNLSVDMAYALEELRKKVAVNRNKNINLFVHYKNNSPEIPALYCDFSDVKNPVYQYSDKINNKYTDKKKNHQTKSDAVSPVIDFVDWCQKKTIDSDHHALIFSGHTMGFLSMGLFKDENSNVSMTMSGLQAGLETITKEILGKKIELLGFDSCVMSMFEVGQQFTDVADTMIASEGSIPNAGWSYAEILGTIAHSDSNVESIAAEFVKKYIETQSRYSIGGVSVDMAAWDLSKLGELNKAFGRLTTNLLKCFETESSAVYKQMKRILLQVHFNSQSYMFEQCLDLGDFCTLLIEEIASIKDETGKALNGELLNVFESSKSVLQEIYNCVILSGFSGGTYQYSTGISVFFPWSLSAYNVSAIDYENLSFVKTTSAGQLWNQFLQKYLCEVSRRKSKGVSQDNDSYKHQIPIAQTHQTSFAHRIPMSPINRIPMSPINRIPMSPINRVPMSPINRIPMSPINRIPMSPINRIPMSPINRMATDSNKFFEQFTNFKNVEASWDIMGYTKEIKNE